MKPLPNTLSHIANQAHATKPATPSPRRPGRRPVGRTAQRGRPFGCGAVFQQAGDEIKALDNVVNVAPAAPNKAGDTA
ncbi:hypothetical protein, partial [Streptomyces albogriseolus]|uniref:hypothetical protein n=1 Tax=Streptomyces albogriseolus TaxID=1887 RepID=UPI00345F5AF9